MLLYKDDPLIKTESMEILLVKLGAWKYWREKAPHVSIIYEVIQSGPLSSSAPNACGTTLLNDRRWRWQHLIKT